MSGRRVTRKSSDLWEEGRKERGVPFPDTNVPRVDVEKGVRQEGGREDDGRFDARVCRDSRRG